MFDQTFVSTEGHSRRPLGVVASLIVQCAIVCASILISIAYTQGLPAAQLRALLIAPRPPVAPHVVENVPKATTSAVIRQFRIVNPAFVVKTPGRPVQVPPAIGIPGAMPSDGANSGGAELPGVVSSIGNPAPYRAAEPAKPSAAAPQRVGGAVAQANLIHQVQPVYPSLAKTARVQGIVEFTAVISTSGTIENLQLVSGHPLLVSAAREAVLQWRYRPTLLNGMPVEVITQITVRFSLAP